MDFLSIYHPIIRINEKTNYDFELSVSHFDADSGQVDSYLTMEPIYTDTFDGELRNDFGAKYTVTLSGNIKATNNVSLIEDKTFAYETQQEGMTATMPIFKDSNDVTITSLPQSGKIKASVTVHNPSDLADKKALG